MFCSRKIDSSDKIKIMYFIGTLGRGGAEGQLLELIEGLDKEKFAPVLVVLKGKDDLYPRCEKMGIPLYLLEFAGPAGSLVPWKLYRVMKNLIRLYMSMKKDTPHIVHAYLFVSYVCGVFMGKLVGVPLIITSRRSLGTFKARVWTPFHRLLEKLVNSWTDLIIANSYAVKEDTEKREKICGSRIIVIHNGVDHEVLKTDGKALHLKKELNIQEGAKVVAMIANLIHYKNHKMLLSAIPIIKRHIPDTHFLLIGRDGGMEGILRDYARSLGIEEYITFAGSRSDIASLLSIIDVSVLTSLEEGFPNVVLESMACGVPVVATSVGGIPEAIDDRKTGFLVASMDHEALAEKILELLSNVELAEAMGRNGIKKVKECFTIEKMVRAHEKLYKDLLKKKLALKGDL